MPKTFNTPILIKRDGNRLDVLLEGSSENDIELEFGIYPLEQNINSDSFQILPYEEYIEEINDNSPTSYTHIDDSKPKAFGLILAFLVLALIAAINLESVFTIESISSALVVFFIGKDIWNELEESLLYLTKRSNHLKYIRSRYLYKREIYNKISTIFDEARIKRYGYNTSLAKQFNLNQQSNSKTLNLLIEATTQKTSRLFSINFATKQKLELFLKGFYIVLRVTTGQRFLGIKFRNEFIQVFDTKECGIKLDEKWSKNSVEMQAVMVWLNIKWYGQRRVKDNIILIRLEK